MLVCRSEFSKGLWFFWFLDMCCFGHLGELCNLTKKVHWNKSSVVTLLNVCLASHDTGAPAHSHITVFKQMEVFKSSLLLTN